MSLNAENALKIALDQDVQMCVRNFNFTIKSPVSQELRQLLMRYAREYVHAATSPAALPVRCVGCRHVRRCGGVCRYD